MKGRGYTVSGTVEAKMDLSINSGTGINEGIFTIKFDNGRTFYYTTPPGELNGLTYGERKLVFVDKSKSCEIQPISGISKKDCFLKSPTTRSPNREASSEEAEKIWLERKGLLTSARALSRSTPQHSCRTS